MGLPKGQTNNPDGGTKGAGTRNTNNKRFIDVTLACQNAGFNPIEALIKIAQDPEIELIHRLKATCLLAEKTTQTFKAIEHKIDDTQQAEMIDSLTKVMQPLVEEFKNDY